MRRASRWVRRIRLVTAAAILTPVFTTGGCLDSDIAKRFREAFGPGFADGLSTAVGADGQGFTGLRQMGQALADGLGAILQPRTPSGSGSSSTGSSSSGSTSSTRH